MCDEDGNCWVQSDVLSGQETDKPYVISNKEYIMHIKDGYYKWFVYDYLYYSKNVVKTFSAEGMDKFLKERKKNLYKINDDNQKFQAQVFNGEIRLKSKFEGDFYWYFANRFVYTPRFL